MRSAHRWLALVAAVSGLSGCGAASGARTIATTKHDALPGSTNSASQTTSSTSTSAASSASTSPTTPAPSPATAPNSRATTTTAPATTATTTPTATTPAITETKTQAQVTPTLKSCGSVDFRPSSSYLASGITALATDCATALAVASASRPHEFDPPRANEPVQGFTADGFTCVGQRNAATVLAAVDYRCTGGPAVVTFQRS